MSTIVACFVALAASSAWPVAAPPAPAADDTRAHAFAQAFYDWYLEAGAERNVETVLLLKKEVLAPALYDALAADVQASTAAAEIVGLDFDPFLNAQEHAYRYELGRAEARDRRYHIPLYGYWGESAKPERHHDVTAEVDCSPAACTFVNFHYVRGAGRDTDLAALLKVLAARRVKPRR